MAGARLALTPIVHQMISVGPIALFAGHHRRDLLPDRAGRRHRHVRAAARRRHGGRLLRAPADHRRPRTPSRPTRRRRCRRPSCRSPPTTSTRSSPQALELMPELLGDEKAGIRYAINGLISMTPDGHPLLGETPEVKGLWSAAASWIKEGPGCGRAVAELMSAAVPTIDVHEADVARFYPSSADDRLRPGPRRRVVQQDVRHRAPGRAVRVARPLRTGARCTSGPGSSARCSTRPPAGSGRTGTRPTQPLLEKYAGRLMERPAEWESRWWSPIINAEHLAMRDACRPRRPVRVHRPRRHRAGRAGRAAAPRRRPARRPGRPGRLHARCSTTRAVSSPTSRSCGWERPRSGSSPAARPAGSDAKWIADHLPDDAQLTDVTSGVGHARAVGAARLGHPHLGDSAMGTRVRRVRSGPAVRSRSGERSCSPRGSPTWASSAGSCTCPPSRPGSCGTCCGKPGGRTGWCRSASACTGRRRGSRRGTGRSARSSTPEYNLVEAGMTRPRVKAADVHRQGRVPGAAGGGAGRGAVHADRGLRRVR